MITLRTGVPGACKTLSAVEHLARMLERWNKHPEEGRPIFVHGVKDLALAHSPLPVKEWRDGNKAPQMVPDWDAMPDGSFVLIDEAQGFFPPRSSAATAPPHVAWLNTHRHRGFDLEVVTQHPKLIDGSVRALVGKHLHFRRLFGGQRSYCYEWDACSDGLSGLANAVGGMYSFPKNVFRWYKSAEIHTKQSFKLPKFLIAFPIAILIGVFAIPKGYAVITNGITGKPINPATAAKVTPSKPASSPVAAAAIAAASAPAVPVPPKGLYERVEEVIAPPKIAGCMTLASRCSCIDVDGKNVVMTPDLCEATSRTLGMMIPYPVEAPKEVRSWKPSVETTAISGPKSSMPHSISTGDIRDLPKRSIVRGSGPSGMGGRS